MYRTYRSVGFLLKAPLLVAFFFLVNMMTGFGRGWWRWAALGLGIAWVIALLRVMRAVLLVGGLAGLAALLNRRR